MPFDVTESEPDPYIIIIIIRRQFGFWLIDLGACCHFDSNDALPSIGV